VRFVGSALWARTARRRCLDGYGPIRRRWPSAGARSVVDERSLARCGRLYRNPKSDRWWRWSRDRGVSQGVAGIIGVRDRTCRTPYCDAPIDIVITPHRQPLGPNHCQQWVGGVLTVQYTRSTGLACGRRRRQRCATEKPIRHNLTVRGIATTTAPAGCLGATLIASAEVEIKKSASHLADVHAAKIGSARPRGRRCCF